MPHPRKSRALARRLIGMSLVLAGLALDAFAGWMILAQSDGEWLIPHAPAAMLWALGILILQDAPPPRALSTDTAAAPRTPVRAPALSGWTAAALCLGILSFPGFGTIGCAVAFGLSYLLRPRATAAQGGGTLLDSVQMLAVTRLPTAGPAREVQPLVDMLRGQNTELRRVVVKALGDQGDRESVQLLRGLLTDPNPDVRSDAAVTLMRLESEYTESINAAVARVEQRPFDIGRQLTLARLCFRYATNGILDPASAHLYLARVRTILETLAKQLPYRTDILVDLARTLHLLGEPEAALRALDEALSQRPGHADAYLLAVEIAFGERLWERLRALAHQPIGVPAETRELLEWWGEALPLPQRRTTHG